MNKFRLLFVFLIISVSVQQTDTDDSIIDKIVAFVKGLANSEDCKCSDTIIEHKTEILAIINDLIADLNAQKKIADIILGYAFRLMDVPDLKKNCNAWDSINKLLGLLKESGIKEFGNKIANNNADIYNLSKEIFNSTDANVTFKDIGKIIKITTDIYVL